MRALIRDCDLVIDQFGVGAYGTLACEAMAAGKPVVAYLSEGVNRVIGEVPPIINVGPDSVGEAVSGLLDDREGAARLGRESVDFVRRFHDGRRSAAALDGFLARE
jgi:glycosyltransferase involved in cell wall biosynthesis